MAEIMISPENTVFVILSFEGPDPYSLAGGLGTRVSNLSRALAALKYETHLFFIGDPKAKGEEYLESGLLTLHRWCQWISKYYPEGVYQGENDKVNDYDSSIPPFIMNRIALPAIAEGKMVVILSEEWHTAETACRTRDILRNNGLSDNAVIFWNANNTFGFNRIDWSRLAKNTIITTVSRYMKHIMRELGVNPLVIPNGIPYNLLRNVDESLSIKLRKGLKSQLLFTKVARYDTSKGWNEAMEATAIFNRKGVKAQLLARGGIEPYGEEVLNNARQMGLKVKDITVDGGNIESHIEAIENGGEADVLNLRFQCSPDLLRILFYSSDAVLANSNHEPFGLVGLEAMASRGIAFTGGTGEDYAVHMDNAVVLETTDPKEIESYVTYLYSHEDKENNMRDSAQKTAWRFTWEEVIKNLIGRTESQASIQGLLPSPLGNHTFALTETCAGRVCSEQPVLS